MAKKKIKALVKNLGYNQNEAGEVVELEITAEQLKSLIEEGFAEEVKAPQKKTPEKTDK